VARSPWSSMGASIQAYLPYYAPPVDPQTNYITGGGASAMMHPEYQPIDEHTRLVNRMPRMLGIRWLYARGGQIKPWFRMISTGAVESTKFQPVLSYQWSGEFNDAIYEAGYPRNLGYTFKVPTIPAAALGTDRSQMLPRPRITRPIFSRRAYTSGVKPLPAVSAYGRGQTGQRGR
jgi:hypothetical protein